MELRPARSEEYAAVGALTVEAYADFTTGAEDGYVAQLADAERRAREASLWVAEEGGVLLGTVTLCPLGSPWRELSADDEGEFRMLAVAPAARGRGVGRALAELALEQSRAAGDRAVVISSLTEMASAHRVYTRLGFLRAPDLDWSPVPDVHLIAFRKELA